VSLIHLVALAAAPAAILLASQRLAPRSALALVITALVTLLIATVVLCWFVPDPSDIGVLIGFYYVVVPCLCIPIAAIIATRLVPTRGRIVSALLLAMFGWIAGIAVGMLVGANDLAGVPNPFWDYALGLALPTVYASCGAVLAAAERAPT
jgi:hypothetical protein